MFRSMTSACAVFASTLLLGSEPALVAQAAAVTATQACDARDPQPDMLLQLLTPARREKFAEASLFYFEIVAVAKFQAHALDAVTLAIRRWWRTIRGQIAVGIA